ncbi:MAG: GNAT family N-acetyltransferase [Gammaproteobacteria bacterium]|nr:GNAT family N-acetyltransferase [Gammaproteobacteria bacterium]
MIRKKRFSVRAAQLKDLDLLVNLERRVFKPSDGMLTRRSFRYHLGSKNILLVANEVGRSSQVVGYILVLVRRLSGRIYSLAICPESQRRGVANSLLKYALEECVIRDLNKVNLDVRVENIAAQELYKSVGFEFNENRPNYYGISEDAYGMQWVNRFLRS